MFNFLMDLKNYVSGKIYERTAVRAIIRQGRKYLFIKSNHHNSYEFPGGGIEVGETDLEALAREVLEETGYIISKNHIELVGTVIEKHKGETEDIFIMTSRYYHCELETTIPHVALDNYQIDFVDLEYALSINIKKDVLGCFPWVKREIAVINYYLTNNKNH